LCSLLFLLFILGF